MAKAEAAEQKALDASDALAREQAWREAARQWERAAERENDAKRRQLYAGKAESARAEADSPAQVEAAPAQPERVQSAQPASAAGAALDPRSSSKRELPN